jgi:hypothetical protein
MKFLSLITLAICMRLNLSAAKIVCLDNLDLAIATQDWGDPHKNQTVEGHTLTIGGKEFARGFGTHEWKRTRLGPGRPVSTIPSRRIIPVVSIDSARRKSELLVSK